jgi:hypothetical protein
VKELMRWLKKQVRKNPQDFSAPVLEWSVLDLGCGNGKNLKYIIENYCESGIGYDISPTAIDQAKKLTKYAKIICTDLRVLLPINNTKETKEAKEKAERIIDYKLASDWNTDIYNILIKYEQNLRGKKLGSMINSDVKDLMMVVEVMCNIDKAIPYLVGMKNVSLSKSKAQFENELETKTSMSGPKSTGQFLTIESVTAEYISDVCAKLCESLLSLNKKEILDLKDSYEDIADDIPIYANVNTQNILKSNIDNILKILNFVSTL